MPLSPLDVDCSHQNADLTNCGAAAHEFCRFPGIDGPIDISTSFHAERIRDAAACTDSPDPEPDREAFASAALATDLF